MYVSRKSPDCHGSNSSWPLVKMKSTLQEQILAGHIRASDEILRLLGVSNRSWLNVAKQMKAIL